jgi:hypothetical protein
MYIVPVLVEAEKMRFLEIGESKGDPHDCLKSRVPYTPVSKELFLLQDPCFSYPNTGEHRSVRKQGGGLRLVSPNQNFSFPGRSICEAHLPHCVQMRPFRDQSTQSRFDLNCEIATEVDFTADFQR